ncbi:hypothetical protein SAMN05444673_6844 [Bacillus sp. OV166]|uniref:hypothetical protein n=1 Tax=Bacillus sp. OV166 TaxID=1882763 RepID=UPI000A2AC2FF|nr:hypothetical protein [Bacillus sp. OV166]SMQ86797.1 hypothetical protein SAMN05444673_6844 [Bacillus sp. OV166]
MLIDGHVKFRFVQRIMGIKGESEINKFITNNEYEVAYRILEFVNNAELLIENYAPARRDTLDYYINNETLIVMKPNKKELVTLFDVTLDSDNKQNTEKIKQYVKKIKMNNNEIKGIKIKQSKQNTISKHLEYMINYLIGDIDEYKMDIIQTDLQHSINICKEYATQEKALRMENRELMSEMFKKIKKS